VVVIVRDRGSGFDLAAGVTASGPGGRGIPDSILGRVRRQGGTATIRTTPGAGTEVELRMPVARA
jgi:signal transduction histidine kinase